jgi:hypothetical protein
MVGDHENLKKMQFLIYFFFVFVLFLLFASYDLWCVVLHGLMSFDVDLCGVALCLDDVHYEGANKAI